jgi:membrane fusion protein (multidrug efflux system)
MKLEFAVPSSYLADLQPGLTILAQTRAYQDMVFEGRVKVVDSRVDPVNRSVLVRAMLPNADGKLKPGMLMTVELLHKPRRALLIPEAALMPKGRQQFVMRVQGEDNLVEKLEIKIGSRQPGMVEVLDGLKAGDRVITHGIDKARVDAPVRIKGVAKDGQSVDRILQIKPDKSAGGT